MGARSGTGRLSRSDALATLTDLDRQVLIAVSSQRVLTQTQLERLFSETPDRTLRYRTERLHRLGLLGRSRPYRDRGSHPFHLWPTRQADAHVRGEPVPTGGERPEPNPAFLAHAAALSELYVVLATEAEAFGLALRDFHREGEARERFRAHGRERALAPDALLDLRDRDGRQLLAFVELDLGTMSRARLKAKAAGYAAYADETAWDERHPFCPALLFLTTTDARTLAFLKLLAAEVVRLGKDRWRESYLDWFVACACAHAHEPARALGEACWDDRTLAGGLTLLDCLEAARRPYDELEARRQAKRRQEEERRSQLLADPDALRAHLQGQGFALAQCLDSFGDEGKRALRLLLHGNGPLQAIEREALAALARLLGDNLLALDETERIGAPSMADEDTVARLAAHYRTRQRRQVETLARREGEGPRLRERRRRLKAGELLDTYAEDRLEEAARADHEARAEQERLRLAYLERREREARGRAREAGFGSLLLRGRAAARDLVDRDSLKVCPRCEEIAYPQPGEWRGYGQPFVLRRCHFCGGSELRDWAERSALAGGAALDPAAVGSDLRSSGSDGLIDDPEPTDDEELWR